MDFVRLTPQISDEWDNLVKDSPDGWMHSYSFWQFMMEKITDWDIQDFSFAVYQGKQLVAVMPLQLRWGMLFSSAMGPAGPAVIGRIDNNYRKKILKQVFLHVKEIAQEVRASTIHVAISPLNEISLNSKYGVNYLINYGFRDVSTNTLISDLTRSESDLWKELAYDARRSVNKARELGYVVERVKWEEYIDEYYDLHVQTYLRTGVTPHPKAYFYNIAMEIAKRGLCVLWVAKDTSGKSVAFHNCGRFKKTAYYWTGCSDVTHMDGGVNYLLLWEAIRGAKNDGCEHYEIGEAFPNSLDTKLQGLTVFKGKFSGELHRLFRGQIDCRNIESNAGMRLCNMPKKIIGRLKKTLVGFKL